MCGKKIMYKMQAELAKNVSRLSLFLKVYMSSISHSHLLMQGQTVIMPMGRLERRIRGRQCKKSKVQSSEALKKKKSKGVRNYYYERERTI